MSKAPKGLLVLWKYPRFCTGGSISLTGKRRQLSPRYAIHTGLHLKDKTNWPLLKCLWLGRPRGNKKPPCGPGAHYSYSPELQLQVTESLTYKIRHSSRSTDRVTLGITAQSSFRAHIDKRVYDLDVGSGHPNGAAAIKGSFVQRLKSYVI